jgi:hypothetical protein
LHASFNPPERASQTEPSVRSGDETVGAAFIVQAFRLGYLRCGDLPAFGGRMHDGEVIGVLQARLFKTEQLLPALFSAAVAAARVGTSATSRGRNADT